jgi:hypothetical protein
MARRRYSCKKLSAAIKTAANRDYCADNPGRCVRGRPKAPAGCKVVYFGKPGCRSAKVVVRCDRPEGLSKAARKRWRRQVRTGELCLRRVGRTKLKRFSTRC